MKTMAIAPMLCCLAVASSWMLYANPPSPHTATTGRSGAPTLAPVRTIIWKNATQTPAMILRLTQRDGVDAAEGAVDGGGEHGARLVGVEVVAAVVAHLPRKPRSEAAEARR